jgi:hypothetical protein
MPREVMLEKDERQEVRKLVREKLEHWDEEAETRVTASLARGGHEAESEVLEDWEMKEYQTLQRLWKKLTGQNW